MRKIIFHFILFGVFIATTIQAQTQQNSLSEIQQIIQTGQLEKAADQLLLYIRQNPDSIKAYGMLGKVYMAIGGPNNRSLSEQILFEGLRLDGKNVELLKLLSEVKKQQDMTELSGKWLNKASKANPSDQKMLADLLDLYIKQNKKKQVESLRNLIADVITKYPNQSSGYLMMGKLETILKHPDKAVPLLEKGLKLDAKNPSIHKALSEAYLLNSQGDQFTEEYYKWLEMETNPQLLQREYELAEMIMENENAEQFKKLIFPEKRTYLLQYWKDHDPYPVTILNERLMEHERRMMYSMEAFHTIQGYLGFDDRGKTYVRWGEPEIRYTGVNTESWYYPSYSLFMAFDFFDRNGYYREIFSPEDALEPGDKIDDGSRFSALKDFYNTRSIQLGGIYSMMAGEENLQTLRQRITENTVERIALKRDKKPRYELKLDIPKLNFIYRAAQFRSDSGRTLMELAYGVPMKQFSGQSTINNSAITYTFQTDLILLDSLKNRSLHTKGKREFACAPATDYNTVNFISEDKNDLFPGAYKMTFQMIELSERRGDFKFDQFNIRDFTGDSLMISDLKFSTNIEVIGIDSATKMEKLSVMPYPFPEINQNKSIYLYFEIYNLLLEPAKGNSYRVSLNVARERTKGEYVLLPLQTIGRIFTQGKPQTIETLYNREGNSRTAIEYIELDLKGLVSGHSRLSVTVEDLIANKKTERSIEFDLNE